MIGGDFDTPIMYQDLANSTMGPMYIPFGTMAGMSGYGTGIAGINSNYLGGARMRRQLDRDKIEVSNRKGNQDSHTLRNALIVIGACIALGSIAPIRKSIKKAGGISKYIKSFFSKKAKPTPKNSGVGTSIKNGVNAIGRGIAKPFKAVGNYFSKIFHKK